jgi:type III secretion protein J
VSGKVVECKVAGLIVGSTFSKRLISLAIPVLLLAACQTDLYTKLTETEANEMVALLVRNGIPASRAAAKDGTSVVKVEESSFADAVALLNDAGLPRPKFATMGDVFADTKLISSPIEERARFIYALSQELSKTLSEIDGVIAARVHLVLPQNDPLREDSKPSSASVFIKHDPGIAIAPLLPQIKTLVTNSVEGLTYDKVSVVFIAAERSHQPASASRNPKTPIAASFSQWLITLQSYPAALALLLLGLAVPLLYLFRIRKREEASQSFRVMLSRNLGLGSSDKPEIS